MELGSYVIILTLFVVNLQEIGGKGKASEEVLFTPPLAGTKISHFEMKLIILLILLY